MVRALAFLVLLVGLAVPLGAVQQGPPGDCEVRTSRDPATNEALTTLTLVLRGPKGPVPVNMTVVKRRPAGAAAAAATDIRLQFDFPLLVGQPDYGQPHVVLTLDKGTRDEDASRYNADPGTVVRGAVQLTVRYSAGALARLARAARVDGRFLGVEFVLTAQQLRAIKTFAA
jgi:hypothetical protein